MNEQSIIKWDLSDFFDSIKDPRIEEKISQIEQKAKLFNNELRGKIKEGNFEPNQLKEWFIRLEDIETDLFYFNVYSYLEFSTNSTDEEVKAFFSKIEEFSSKISEYLIFFGLELNQIDDDKFEKFLNAPELAKYKHFLMTNRKRKDHQLSEKEEQIILMKDLTGNKAFLKLYTEITSRFTFEIEIDGEKKTMTGSQLSSLLQHKDRAVRKRALELIVSKYKQNELVLTHIFNNVIKDFDLEMQKRNYEKPVQMRNLENEVEDEIVDTLEKTTTDSYNKLVERYYLLKQKLLNYTDLHMYDIYCPVGEINKHYTYEEAISIIEKATDKFDPEFRKIVHMMVEQHHIDVTPRKGKEGGAYCHYGKLKQLPFVFVNFAGTTGSVLTLAHELGHAIHFYYILQNQNFINISPTIPMAEVASVFSENMTFDYLLNQSDISKQEKIALLCEYLEGNFATSHRQNAFYRFESRIHELMAKKLPTAEDYVKIFTEEMKRMFGKAIVGIDEEYSHYVYLINHFLHTPFYVYAYNMSNLMVIALYQLYLEKGKEFFIPRYKKLLAAGGSMTPTEMLKEFDIDLKDQSFWKKGLDYLAKKIDEIEELMQR